MWLGIFTRNPLLEWSKLIECLQIPKLMSHKNAYWCWWSSLGSSSIDEWSHIPSPCGAALLPLPLGTGHETYIILQQFVLDFFFFWFIFVPFFILFKFYFHCWWWYHKPNYLFRGLCKSFFNSSVILAYDDLHF